LTSGRRAFAWAVLGVAAFIVYGSLVPFQFRALAPGAAVDLFRIVLATGVRIESRSDAIVNVMLGVPLGFALLGWAAADRGWTRPRIAGRGLVLLPVCVLFSALVEFSQLFTVSRVCSASDIAAQSIGAAIGMAVWVLCGQAFTDRVRQMWTRADVNTAGRLLIAYVVLLAFIQTLPFDVSASPAKLYRKLRDGGVRSVPFGEFTGMKEADRWTHIGKLAQLVGLYFPVGLLAARLKGRVETWSIVRVMLAATVLAVGLEGLQLVVQSRTPSATDALVGALAAVTGWYAGRVHHEGLALPFAVCWGIVWCALMTPITQPPAGTPRRDTPRLFDWVPGLPLEAGDPLDTLEEMLTKLVLFGLLGVLVAAWRLPPRSRRAPGGSLRSAVAIAVGLGLVVSGLIENGQRWNDAHTPCITDVLLGGLGAGLGVLAARLLCERPAGPQVRSERLAG
jgi:VanZ family protein